MLELQLNEIEKQWNNKGKNGENGGTGSGHAILLLWEVDSLKVKYNGKMNRHGSVDKQFRLVETYTEMRWRYGEVKQYI